MNAPIRPRTKDERMAYMSGYAAAINDVDRHGLKSAANSLKLMVETEERMETTTEAEMRTQVEADGWREGRDHLWRNDRFGGSYSLENAARRIGSERGEVTHETETSGATQGA